MGSEEQQEPPQKKLRLGTTEAVATANPWTRGRIQSGSKTDELQEEAERLQKHERKLDLKEKSANDWAECYLKGSAASASSHANREVDGDMERLCSCRSCGGWISFPELSCAGATDGEAI